MKGMTASRARGVAKRTWGNINTQKKLGPNLWWFDTWGHGGYVLLVAHNEVQDWMKPFQATYWTILGAPVFYAYVFEEDCDWAVLQYNKPEEMERDYNERRAQGLLASFPTLESYGDHVIDVMIRWTSAEAA